VYGARKGQLKLIVDLVEHAADVLVFLARGEDFAAFP
jgi:hypothetical protein